MNIYYRIKITFVAGRRSVFIAFIRALAAKLTKNASLVPDLKIAGSVFKTNADNLQILTAQTKNHVDGAAEAAKILVEQIKNDFRVDANCVEAAVNAANDPTIATKMGFEVKKPGGNANIAHLIVKNALTVGNLKVRTKWVKKYHCYLIECTQKFSDGSPDIITEKTMTNPISEVSGFISGALYLIRVRAVLSHNVLCEWSDYVLIRVN